MRCAHCHGETDPSLILCQHCHADRQAPLIWPDAKLYAVRGIGVAACLGVAVSVLVTVLSALSSLLVRDRVRAAVDAGDATLLAGAERIELIALSVDVAVLIAAGVFVIIWLWRARRNLDAFPGAEADHGPGWAIGGWFVPFANFFIPYRMVYQVSTQSVHRNWVKAVAGAWWAGWLGSYCLGRVFGALEPSANATADELLQYFDRAATGELVGAAVTAVSGACLIILISTTSRAQTSRIERGRAAHVPAVTPGAAGGTISM
ncbi:DUF4328 domain-containing protein [Catellatospora vulcania]|uniref:DUF4328 domain-containing protein n=1 Tax=Catellatospora vulcania TaxID=1460450 RepID=UPI0012D45B8F|nr:DUF4328 domain-containing protein [Catellatospora vulcania]